MKRKASTGRTKKTIKSGKSTELKAFVVPVRIQKALNTAALKQGYKFAIVAGA